MMMTIMIILYNNNYVIKSWFSLGNYSKLRLHIFLFLFCVNFKSKPECHGVKAVVNISSHMLENNILGANLL